MTKFQFKSLLRISSKSYVMAAGFYLNIKKKLFSSGKQDNLYLKFSTLLEQTIFNS